MSWVCIESCWALGTEPVRSIRVDGLGISVLSAQPLQREFGVADPETLRRAASSSGALELCQAARPCADGIDMRQRARALEGRHTPQVAERPESSCFTQAALRMRPGLGCTKFK